MHATATIANAHTPAHALHNNSLNAMKTPSRTILNFETFFPFFGKQTI